MICSNPFYGYVIGVTGAAALVVVWIILVGLYEARKERLDNDLG